MADERDDDQYGEESEYHFSDDQAYDAEEGETVTHAAPPATKQTILEKLLPYRRMIIGIVVFFVLIFTIYGVLSPKPEAEKEITRVPEHVTPHPAEQQMAPLPQPQPLPPAPAVQTIMPVPQAPIAAPVPAPAPLPAPVEAQTPPPQLQGVVDRLTALEEQNAKLVNLLQTQVAQKMADYDAENNAAQDKVRALNKRMANMEASLNKMAQLMKDNNPGRSTLSAMPMPRSTQPKVVYTVQAIIPGRAWLKNDNGDTVTVAEGDILKDFGRIIKIDPYDGIVEIDTGNKIIALSYGAGGE